MNEVTEKKPEILCIVTQTPEISIPEELQEIERDIKDNNSKFNVKATYVTTNKQVAELIQGASPNTQIIHISAEGRPEDGAIEIIDQKNNKKDFLKPDVLASFFESANNIRCVILNFCYSKPVTELIKKSNRIPCVIGIEGKIEVAGAAYFSSSFYKALKGKSLTYEVLKEAFLDGKRFAKDRITEKGEYYIFQQKPEIHIETPKNGSIVPYPCEGSGTFKNLYKGASMWAYIKATSEGKFYVVPINNYPNDSVEGKWKVPLKIGPPEGDDDDYKIGVFMVNPETTPGLKSEWDKAAKEPGYWALDELPNEGIEVFAEEIEVTRQ
jgi:hypothetical protein